MRYDWTPYQERVNDLIALMDERHQKYGSGNIDAFGLLGIVVRLSDKIERLKQWVSNPLLHAPDESTEDTFKDMANYAIIGLMLIHGTWPPLPLEELE